jgi:hypothetical protein
MSSWCITNRRLQKLRAEDSVWSTLRFHRFKLNRQLWDRSFFLLRNIKLAALSCSQRLIFCVYVYSNSLPFLGHSLGFPSRNLFQWLSDNITLRPILMLLSHRHLGRTSCHFPFRISKQFCTHLSFNFSGASHLLPVSSSLTWSS